MAKGSRGLPANYSLDVPDNVATRPINLPDYLEETIRPAIARPTIAASVPPPPSPPTRNENVISMPPAADSFREALLLNSRPPPQDRPAGQQESRVHRSSPRKQLNMNPDTLRMVEELLETIQRYSGQKDAKASEMFHALVTTLYEAKDLLNLQSIPPRGRWGTPTARAFPIALKNAFQAAVAELHRRRTRTE